MPKVAPAYRATSAAERRAALEAQRGTGGLSGLCCCGGGSGSGGGRSGRRGSYSSDSTGSSSDVDVRSIAQKYGLADEADYGLSTTLPGGYSSRVPRPPQRLPPPQPVQLSSDSSEGDTDSDGDVAHQPALVTIEEAGESDEEEAVAATVAAGDEMQRSAHSRRAAAAPPTPEQARVRGRGARTVGLRGRGRGRGRARGGAPGGHGGRQGGMARDGSGRTVRSVCVCVCARARARRESAEERKRVCASAAPPCQCSCARYLAAPTDHLATPDWR
jgi:hypothetical protein